MCKIGNKYSLTYDTLPNFHQTSTECSVKSSQGFRLHKGVVRYAHKAPTVTECERMCHSENAFRCVTYSFRYNNELNDNCLLCDRPINLLDYYADLEPDRDYDIYAMSDDPVMCQEKLPAVIERQNSARKIILDLPLLKLYSLYCCIRVLLSSNRCQPFL